MNKIDKILVATLIILGLALPTLAVVNNYKNQGNNYYLEARIVEHGGWSHKTLYLKLDKDNKLTIISEDVMHSFTVPAFNISVPLYPGHAVTVHITPTKAGTFPFQCMIYCSPLHPDMTGVIIVQ